MVHVAAYAVAWTALAVLTMGSRPPRWAPTVLLLVPIYLASSTWTPETREGIDTWFQADHWRYVAAARDGVISPRHLGFPVFLGGFRCIENATVAETALRAGSAMAGALATGASLLVVGPSRAGVAVVAQPGLPAASYSYDPRMWMLVEPATIAWIVLAVVIAFGAWPGMKSRCAEASTVEGTAFRALAAFVAIRFAWHVIFAPREVILFSAQTHLALALLLASSAGATTALRKRILIAAASVLGVLLVFVNGGYLVNLP